MGQRAPHGDRLAHHREGPCIATTPAVWLPRARAHPCVARPALTWLRRDRFPVSRTPAPDNPPVPHDTGRHARHVHRRRGTATATMAVPWSPPNAQRSHMNTMDSGHGPHSGHRHGVRISDVVDHDVRDPDDARTPGAAAPCARTTRRVTLPGSTHGPLLEPRTSSLARPLGPSTGYGPSSQQPDEPRVRSCQADLSPEWLDRVLGIGN
jgi:hypothetical protein